MVVHQDTEDRVRQILSTVMDPEIPVISVLDLGMIHNIRTVDGELEVQVLPTYSGCPATDYIPQLIEKALRIEGFVKVRVMNVHFPVWGSDRITNEGLRLLKEYGIAPPKRTGTPDCPLCGHQAVEQISAFGSTPCKALFRCINCLEPFEYFKCH